jgi:hypothetical protein
MLWSFSMIHSAMHFWLFVYNDPLYDHQSKNYSLEWNQNMKGFMRDIFCKLPCFNRTSIPCYNVWIPLSKAVHEGRGQHSEYFFMSLKLLNLWKKQSFFILLEADHRLLIRQNIAAKQFLFRLLQKLQSHLRDYAQLYWY